MNLENVSLEQLDEHVDQHLETVTKTSDPKVCDIIRLAIPILSFVKKLLFFRPKWKTGIEILITFLQTLCPDPAQTISTTKPNSSL